MGQFGLIKSEAEFPEKNNLTAVVDPVVGDDNTLGYQDGSVWVNTLLNKVFICADTSTGAAIWKEVGSGGAGGTTPFNHTTYAFDYVGATGTWQGVNVAAVGSTEWNDRWRVASFAGTGGADGFYINFRLSESYTSGADLKVSLDFSSLVGAGGGTAAIRVGLCQPLPGGPFGTESSTAYAAQDLPIAAGDSISTFVAQFSGVTINPGDQIAIQVFRDPGAPGDTTNDTIYNATVLIEEV